MRHDVERAGDVEGAGTFVAWQSLTDRVFEAVRAGDAEAVMRALEARDRWIAEQEAVHPEGVRFHWPEDVRAEAQKRERELQAALTAYLENIARALTEGRKRLQAATMYRPDKEPVGALFDEMR